MDQWKLFKLKHKGKNSLKKENRTSENYGTISEDIVYA